MLTNTEKVKMFYWSQRFVLFVIMYCNYIYFRLTFECFFMSTLFYYLVCDIYLQPVFGNSRESNFYVFRISNNGQNRMPCDSSVSDETQNWEGPDSVYYLWLLLTNLTTMV